MGLACAGLRIALSVTPRIGALCGVRSVARFLNRTCGETSTVLSVIERRVTMSRNKKKVTKLWMTTVHENGAHRAPLVHATRASARRERHAVPSLDIRITPVTIID